jgi:hypothetical protein
MQLINEAVYYGLGVWGFRLSVTMECYACPVVHNSSLHTYYIDYITYVYIVAEATLAVS